MLADDGKEEILNSMLEDVSNSYDKRPGSFIYDALSPVAGQFSKTNSAIIDLKDRISIDNLSGDELAQRIKERTGIERKEATRAKDSVIVTGSGTINAGDLFETPGGIQFRSKETKNIVSSGKVLIEAAIAGSLGNVPANTVTLFPVTLAGFTAVNNPNPIRDGFDAETDADLLQRYYDRIRTPVTSGNKAHYKNWAMEVPGVGDARILSLWNGPNTVKVIIIDSDKTPASSAVVNAVQNHIDPGSTGMGDGEAPIGAITTVVSAAPLSVDVSATIVLSSGYTVEQVISNIRESLIRYFRDIAYISSIVSYSKLGLAIISSTGVDDYVNLLVNGGTSNISIESDDVAVLGALTIGT